MLEKVLFVFFTCHLAVCPCRKTTHSALDEKMEIEVHGAVGDAVQWWWAASVPAGAAVVS